MNPSRVLLLNLSVRTAERSGKTWYSGYLGACRVVGFPSDETDRFGNPIIKLYVVEARSAVAAGQAPTRLALRTV